MYITRMAVRGFRNIAIAELKPSPELNLIFGDNGSGKTSLLEALSTLSRGHSFRTRKFTYLIRNEEDEFVLFAAVTSDGHSHKMGIQRHRTRGSQFRVDGVSVTRATELASLLPVQILDAHSFRLLDGGPKSAGVS